MYEQIAAYLQELNYVTVFFRLLLAAVCGGMIGIERALKRRPAGFRTYMLVCIGSTMVMLTNQYLMIDFPHSDPARLGAQVISGIGFLGAGTIIVTRQHQVIGLTTAAGLWAAACLGLAIGIGFYELATLGSLFILFIITLMHKLDNRIVSRSKLMEAYLELNEGYRIKDFMEYVTNKGVSIRNIEVVKSKYSDQGNLAALVTLRLPRRRHHYEFIEEATKAPCVDFIEEV